MALYHIDTDMGVDDGLAMMMAARLIDGPMTVSTVFGNVPVEIATRNALIFRDLLGARHRWTILGGAARACDGFWRDARHIHGADGLGGATAALEPALLERATSQRAPSLAGALPPGADRVILVALGPATNLPHLVSWYGAAVVERIVLMSGAFFDHGNIVPDAEFNAHCDPRALQATLGLAIPVTMVPLDVCRKVQLQRATVAAYGASADTPLSRLIADSHMRYMDFYQQWEGIDGCFPHDALTVLAALEPDRMFRLRGRVSVECEGEARGRTTIMPDPSSHVDVVTGGDLKWIRDTIAQLLGVSG